ncbi:MAG: hypothetical protein EB059_11115 [Alphaproteobacteria bacterium]|nr:hypothetical protein [Alphaproteobacteria bacterium]
MSKGVKKDILAKCDELIEKLQDLNKSNYRGYNIADNVRRKAGNVGDEAQSGGKNVNVKAYSSKPGQLSARQQADLEAKRARKMSSKSPVKVYTPEEVEQYKKRAALKQSERSEEDMEKMASQRLANMMNQKAMLGSNIPRQPTDEELFGHLVPRDEMVKAAEDKWNNAHNDWLKEAMKPISSRFSSQEEEEAYWTSIKVSDRDDGKPGY